MGLSQKRNELVSRIPIEIWQEVFVHTLPYEQPYLYVQPSTLQAPLKLGMVCRNWRRLSITCPRLWTSVSISLHDIAITWLLRDPSDILGLQDFYTKIEAGVEQWLSRSGRLPLTISYKESRSPRNQELGISTSARLREILTSVASRWRHIEIGWFDDSDDLLDLLSVGTGTPLLESLILGRGLSAQRRLNLARLTSLTHLSYGTMDVLPDDIDEVVLPPHLKHLGVNTRHFNRALRVLRRCPSLISAQLSILLPPQSTFSESVTLSYLEKLSVEFISIPAAEQFWDSLTLPSLKVLELGWICWDSPSLSANIPSMLLRSRCNLEHLVIQQYPSLHDVIGCLSASPDLQSVTFRNFEDSEALLTMSTILERLAEDDTIGRPMMFTFCSKLHKLTLEQCDPDDIYIDALINFLISRCHVIDDGFPPSGDILEELEWSTEDCDSGLVDIWREALEESAQLQKCITKGLRVYITMGENKYFFNPTYPQGICRE